MKKVFFVVFFIALFLVGGAIAFKLIFKQVNIQSSTAFLSYQFDNKTISEELSEGDFLAIRKILNKRILFYDNPSCGFSADISLQFGDDIFCIARDTCPIFKDQNSGKFFRISVSNRDEIEKILQKYGAVFPCV